MEVAVISQDALDAAMRVFAALAVGGRTDDAAELFAHLVSSAGDELEGGFEELTAGLLQVCVVLADLLARRSDLTREQVVQAVGLAFASRPPGGD